MLSWVINQEYLNVIYQALFQAHIDANKYWWDVINKTYNGHYLISGLEGFGRYPVFTMVFTGKYRPGKNRFWTQVGKTGKNTISYVNNKTQHDLEMHTYVGHKDS